MKSDAATATLDPQRRAGRAVAERLAAQDAVVAASLPAAVSLACAALLCGHDLARIRALPGRSGPSAIALQKGHAVTVGAPLCQLVRLAGAEPREAGAVDQCLAAELEALLEAGAVAGLWVAGAGAPSLLDLPAFHWACRSWDRPVLVVDPASGNWAARLDAGASLVALDGAALGGPPCGVVVGAGPLIEACRLQRHGIGAALLASDPVAAALALAAEKAEQA
ncbi:hypothetical protein SH611_04315 [Geminicoccaceae bacterium 1502E]|nr:hypothetical protein [Geminicoccaceae bacterium 1502E]